MLSNSICYLQFICDISPMRNLPERTGGDLSVDQDRELFDYVSGVSDGVLPWVVFLTACQGGHTMGRLVGRAKAGQVGI